MVSIDWSKGFILAALRRNDNEVVITSDKLDKKGGSRFLNLKKCPMRAFWLGRYSFPDEGLRTWEQFLYWLQQAFHHLDNGVYLILAWRGSTRWNPGRTRKVRPMEPFAKFEVQDGTVICNTSHKRAVSSGKTYRIWLLFEEEGTGLLMPRTKKLTLKDLGYDK